MDDWLKITLTGLASGTVGFITGILAEPIKKEMRDRKEKDESWESLIKELASNYQVIVEIYDDVSNCDISARRIQFDCFKHILNTKPLLFSQLSEGWMVRDIVANLEEFQSDVESKNWTADLKRDFQSRLIAEQDIKRCLRLPLLAIEYRFSSRTRTILRQYLVGQFRNRIPT